MSAMNLGKWQFAVGVERTLATAKRRFSRKKRKSFLEIAEMKQQHEQEQNNSVRQHFGKQAMRIVLCVPIS